MKFDSIIKSIVSAVKSKEDLQGVTCIYSNSRNISENPVCSFTLCLGLGRVKYAENPNRLANEFSTEIKMCLLAPTGAGGKQLSEVSWQIAEAIRENLSISAIEISEPSYNGTSSTLFADIAVTVEDLSLADTTCDFYINGEKTEGIVSFEIQSTELKEKEPELLNGYIYSSSGAESFFVELKTSGFLNISDESELEFSYESYSEKYSRCCVIKIKRELSRWGNLSFTYEITAESSELTMKEVHSV